MPFISIKDVFAQGGLTSSDQFEERTKAWRVAADSGSQERILAFFSRECGLSEEVFLRQLAHAFGWPYVDLPKLSVSAEARQKISTKVAFQYFVLPIQLENGALKIAVSNPFDTAMLGAVQFDAHCPIEFALATKDEIEKALKKYYGVGAETLDELSEEEPIELLVGEDKEITEGDQEASVIKFVNQIIWEAYKDRSTDIHFEPAEDELRIRYRIDGILHQTPMLPQDGRINVRIKGEEIDIRVSTVPTVYGESVSLRLLTRGKIFLTLDKLGFSPEDQQALREIIVKPHGIMLVTGPTGAGKSTTLYACLSTINSVHKRIITIEEPVEYELKGINQIAVRSDIGLTFAVGLRHILRQDPNVIMVGEIRDLETAEIAIRAALTGHLVFSTLHTNDAPSAFTRLIDMGIEPFLVASSVEAVLAQRRVRTICPHCKVEQKVQKDYLRRISFPEDEIETAKFWRGAGCEECRELGYQGRMGIYELLVLNEAVRPLILGRAAASTIAQRAMEQGMRTLRHDGWNKVRSALTTIEEVLRVTQTEEHMKGLVEA